MNKHKLINRETNEEHICSKIVIDGFDYYVNDNEIKKDNHIYFPSEGIICKWNKELFNPKYCKKVISTNNPSIDLPKVVDKVEELLKSESCPAHSYNKVFKDVYISGYNKSQESHPFSEDDLISFGKFIYDYDYRIYGTKTNEELLQIWKEQRIKNIYYEMDN